MDHHLLKKCKLYLLATTACLCLATVTNAARVKNVVTGDNTVNPVIAADVPVTGKVADENNQTLVGVTVTLKGTTVATTTDVAGNFTINVPAPQNAVLVFNYIGYETQEVALNGRREVKVQLKPTNSSLSEVVIVGYGSQRRASITGAISSVNSVTLNALPVASIDQALQGRVAGLTVTNNGGPGNPPIVTIRGISSISFGSDPLYVIDGFPAAIGNSYDGRDVERVDVLKDASQAAIYGSRATNGVIMITTKKGQRDGKISVNYDAYAGIQSPAKYFSLLNTNQYVQYANALNGVGNTPRLQPANFNQPVYPGASQTYAQTNTDWQRAYLKRNAFITSNSLSLSGGNDISRFFSSLGYFKQDGIAQAQSFERINYRINSDHNVSKVFTFGENVYISASTQYYEPNNGNRTPLTNVVRMLPYIPLHDPTTLGGYQGPKNSFDASDPTNPVEAALIGENRRNSTNIIGTAYVEAKIFPWLRFKSTFGANYLNVYQTNYTPIYNDGGTLSASTASLAFQRNTYFNLLGTQQLILDKSIGDHHINATAVYEQQSVHAVTQNESGTQNTNDVRTLSGASNIAANNTNEDNVIQSVLGRVTYDYKGKYLLNASIRRDGLSIWAPGHKFATFPAVSIGWNINKESFLSDSKTISELKLRAGYGVTGLNPGGLGNYPWWSPVRSNQAYYPFAGGASGNANASFTNGLSNPQLSWEKTKQLNVGVDMGFYNNKFTVVAEYFSRETIKDTYGLILLVPTAPSQGYLSQGVYANSGVMRNTGIELQLGYHKNTGEFKYDITGLISGVRNKIVSLNTATASINSGGDADFGGGDIFTNTTVGQSIQYFYGWVTDGIFQTAAEVASSPTQANAKPGDIKFKDLSGPNGKPDGVIDSYDRTNLGSFMPKFSYSLNYNASYKNFDFAVFFQGVQGNKVLNAERIILEGMPRLFNAGTQVLNAWTPTNTNTSIPRAVNSDPNRNGRLSTRWVEDGSYLRLKNVMIGYTLPSSAMSGLQKAGFKHLRLYVSAQNIATITGYKGLDPEIGSKNGTLSNGVDFGQYPSARSFQFGLQAGF